MNESELIKRAKQGDAESQFQIGCDLLENECADGSRDEGLVWLHLAADVLESEVLLGGPCFASSSSIVSY
jgi:hypothetical protein